MVSALSPLSGQSQQVDLAGALAGGQQAYQRKQLNDQAMQQNQQQISRADYEQGVERLKVINRLALKVKELPNDQRYGFVNSLNQDMLKSVGIDPAQINSVQLDDQSLDALIAQTGAAIPEGSKYRKESVNTNLGLQVYDPSTGTYTQAKDEQGRPLSGAQYDPSLQGQIATAKQTGQNAADIRDKPIIAGDIARAEAAVELGTKPKITSAVATAENEADAEAKAKDAARKNAKALAVYEAGTKNLSGALANTTTGPVAGRIPAVTSAQQTAEGSIAAMAPVLKDLFREAGEGTFTKDDQQILMAMLPTRNDLPDARAAKLKNVDDMVRAKLQDKKTTEAQKTVNWNDLP